MMSLNRETGRGKPRPFLFGQGESAVPELSVSCVIARVREYREQNVSHDDFRGIVFIRVSMQRIMPIVLLTLCLILGPYSANALPTVKADSSFEFLSLVIGGDKGSEVIIGFASKNIDGKLAVCGFYVVTGASGTVTQVARLAIKKMKFSVGNNTVIASGGHFKKAELGTKLKEITSRCQKTNVDWHSSYSKPGKGAQFQNPGRFGVAF